MNNQSDNIFNNLPDNSEVESRARTLFRSACEHADSYHTLRLGLARRKALAAGTAHPGARLWAPLAGAAVACCALVVGLVLLRPDGHVPPSANLASAAPIAAAQPESVDEVPEVGTTQMEMVQDLDFYRWLAAQPGIASAPAKDGR